MRRWGKFHRVIPLLIITAILIAGSLLPGVYGKLIRPDTGLYEYTQKELLFSGLSGPLILGTDPQGNIYFTEWDGSTCYLKRFNPTTLIIEVVLSEREIIDIIEFDWFGNLYYVVGMRLIKKLPQGGNPILIYNASPDYIIDMAVDLLGNIYFSTLNYFGGVTPPPIYETHLYWIPYTQIGVILIESYSGIEPVSIHGIITYPVAYFGIAYIVSKSDGIYIYRYQFGRKTLLLYKPIINSGSIPYVTLYQGNHIYYIYRQRYDGQYDRWGYLEIGVIRYAFIPFLTEVEVLYSEYYDDRSVWVWWGPGTSNIYLDVYLGDVFTSVIFWFDNNTVTTNILYLDDATRELHIIARSIVQPGRLNTLPFALDLAGNLYYSKRVEGEIWVIYRDAVPPTPFL